MNHSLEKIIKILTEPKLEGLSEALDDAMDTMEKLENTYGLVEKLKRVRRGDQDEP